MSDGKPGAGLPAESAAAEVDVATPKLLGMAFRRMPSATVILAVNEDGGDLARASILDCSDSFEHLVGADRAQIVGEPLAVFLHPQDVPVLEAGPTRLLDPTRHPQVRIVRPGWGVVWVALAGSVMADGVGPDRLVVSLDDVTAVRRSEQALEYRASHDPLTGLSNRAVLVQHLSLVLVRLGRRPGTVAVLFIDLDGFKNINDTFGHRVGDAVLQEVARRISLAVRRDDMVTRMGGDEFVVVCDALENSSESVLIAERVRSGLEEPFEIQGRSHTLSGSVGVAQTSDPGATSEDLLRRADLAMYRAKERGRNRIEFFAADLEDRVRGRVRMVELLRAALREGRVTLDVQPVVRVKDSSVAGYEAFARIVMPDSTTILPDEFLEPAEQSGLIVRIDTAVLDQALEWLRARRSSGSEPWIGVNVSARQLANTGFPQLVLDRLNRHDLSPEDLVLELGEPAMTDATGMSLSTLRRLRSSGVHVALDRFGTGMSSLTAIRDLPVDFVKLDRSFVDGVGKDPADESIVSAVISVGHDLGRVVIAEGVTTPEQAEFLRERGCDLCQGNLFGSPAPIGGASSRR